MHAMYACMYVLYCLHVCMLPTHGSTLFIPMLCELLPPCRIPDDDADDVDHDDYDNEDGVNDDDDDGNDINDGNDDDIDDDDAISYHFPPCHLCVRERQAC